MLPIDAYCDFFQHGSQETAGDCATFETGARTERRKASRKVQGRWHDAAKEDARSWNWKLFFEALMIRLALVSPSKPNWVQYGVSEVKKDFEPQLEHLSEQCRRLARLGSTAGHDGSLDDALTKPLPGHKARRRIRGCFPWVRRRVWDRYEEHRRTPSPSLKQMSKLPRRQSGALTQQPRDRHTVALRQEGRSRQGVHY